MYTLDDIEFAGIKPTIRVGMGDYLYHKPTKVMYRVVQFAENKLTLIKEDCGNRKNDTTVTGMLGLYFSREEYSILCGGRPDDFNVVNGMELSDMLDGLGR